ncbi:hypothetical protein HQ590_05605 [bacterium]|nr:hypothetical protein [bacterium]
MTGAVLLAGCTAGNRAGLLMAANGPDADAGEAAAPAERTISFARGKWDAREWRPVRMMNQDTPRELTQNDEFIGVTKDSFRKDDYSTERDNAVLLTDTLTAEGEIEVTFRSGEGLGQGGYSAPGLLISPVVADGIVEKAIGIFVGDYATAVWLVESDKASNRVSYAHLGQLARTTDPVNRHVLRCRFSKKQGSIAVQVDDSDVLVFQFIGNKHLSKVDLQLNSQVCLVGCHGVCEFYAMKIRQGGTLPFIKRYEPAKP